MKPSQAALVKFVLPQDQVNVAMEDLNIMDIHHATLFPGYAGCVRAARVQLAPELVKYSR